MKAYDLRDGSERWSLPGLTDEPIITPVAGDGLLFLSSYNMKTNPEVIGLPEFDELLEEYDKDKDGRLTREEIKGNQSVLARNELKERIMATPAIVDGKIYVRTENHLYAFGLPE